MVATGAAPRPLPGQPTLDGIHMLRTLDDCLAIRADLDARPGRVVVVGAGFIGAEVAATCRRRHLDVTVLEALPSPMVRGLGPMLGDVLAALHRDHGVDLRTGVGVDGLRRRRRASSACDSPTARRSTPTSSSWASASHPRPTGSRARVSSSTTASCCDETLLAAPGIVAAGDACRWPNPLFDGERMRLEHWTNAAEQGVAAAARLLAADGGAQAYAPVPFVWSDQYDLKIQVVGHVRGDDEVEVVDGSLEERRFVAAVGRDGRLVGAVGFGRPRVADAVPTHDRRALHLGRGARWRTGGVVTRARGDRRRCRGRSRCADTDASREEERALDRVARPDERRPRRARRPTSAFAHSS